MSVKAPSLRSFSDRVRQVLFFEMGGLLLITPVFAWASGERLLDSVWLLAIVSLMAACWNGIYCTSFDWLEGRMTGRPADQRPKMLRLVHALGFELGLMILSLPVVMWWTGMDFWKALLADFGLAMAYVAYAYLFNLTYDRFFPIVQKSENAS